LSSKQVTVQLELNNLFQGPENRALSLLAWWGIGSRYDVSYHGKDKVRLSCLCV